MRTPSGGHDQRASPHWLAPASLVAAASQGGKPRCDISYITSPRLQAGKSMHGVAGRGQLQTAGSDTKPSPTWRGWSGVRKLQRVGDENAVARMMGAAIARWRQVGSLEGGHHVPVSRRPRRQAPIGWMGWMGFAGITCY